MTVAPVADHVDHDVLVEPLAVGEREPGDADAGLGVVAVDVEDRRLDRLGDVGASTPTTARTSGGVVKPELVVDDDVDRAADPVALDQRQVERLGHDALAGERGVAVHQDRQDREAPVVVVRDLVHPGPGHALDDGVDRFEVRRVGREARRGSRCRRGC